MSYERTLTIPLEEYEVMKKKVLDLELKVVYLENVVGVDNVNIMFGNVALKKRIIELDGYIKHIKQTKR